MRSIKEEKDYHQWNKEKSKEAVFFLLNFKTCQKSLKESQKRLHVVNQNSEIAKTYVNKEDIEREIHMHNIKHFTKAHNTKVY